MQQFLYHSLFVVVLGIWLLVGFFFVPGYESVIRYSPPLALFSCLCIATILYCLYKRLR